MKTTLFLLFMIGCLQFAAAQSGTVVVNKDPRVDLLINKQIEINEITTRDSRRHSAGYRILVVSSNDRNKVIEAKTTMYREFPELKAYMMYQAPFFRLKVGNFKDRAEAEAYLSQVNRLFKSGVYIVPDTIEIRPTNDN
jgi:hypothetical protein